MVWGVLLPNGFGEFWPSGDFEYDKATREEGWFKRLSNYYAEQTPQEQKRLFDFKGSPVSAAHRYGTFPCCKLTSEPGTNDNSELEPPYGSIEPHELPRSFDLDKSYDILASVITLNAKVLAIDQEMKNIIEKNEPNVHEFYPFVLTMPRGKTYPNQYYIMRICQYFDAFSREDTREGSIRILPPYQDIPELVRLNNTKVALNGLAMDKSVFGDAHVWRDRTFKEELTCFSDALMVEIRQAGLRLPKLFQLKEV